MTVIRREGRRENRERQGYERREGGGALTCEKGEGGGRYKRETEK